MTRNDLDKIGKILNCGGQGGKPGPCPRQSPTDILDRQEVLGKMASTFRDAGSRTYVSQMRSPNMGKRHFIDISHKDSSVERQQAEKVQKFFDIISSKIRSKNKNARTYSSMEKSPNMGTRVFLDVEG